MGSLRKRPTIVAACLGAGGRRRRRGARDTVLLDGSHLAEVEATHNFVGQPVVTIRFDDAGTRRLATATTAEVVEQFAIVVDDKVLNALRIVEPITGSIAQISRNCSFAEVRKLELILSARALPPPLTIAEERCLDRDSDE